MPRDLTSASAWAVIESDLRRAMLARGVVASAVDRVLADLAPVYRAVERGRVTVEPELVYSLLSVAADRQRRKVQAQRTRTV